MQYHILIIITDGQMTDESRTKEAITNACKYPLSIVCVGVGNGDFSDMKTFDSKLQRKFDNVCSLFVSRLSP